MKKIRHYTYDQIKKYDDFYEKLKAKKVIHKYEAYC